VPAPRSPSASVVSTARRCSATYAGTLERGERDQAAFQVPASVTIGEGTQLVSPLDAAPLSRYAQIARGGWATPVLRRSGTVPLIGLSPVPVDVLGVPAGDVRRLAPWRSQYGTLPVARPAPLAGISLPASSRLTVTASAHGVPVMLTASVVGGMAGSSASAGHAAARPDSAPLPGRRWLVSLSGLADTCGCQDGDPSVQGAPRRRFPAASRCPVSTASTAGREAASGVRAGVAALALGAGDAVLLRAPTDRRPADRRDRERGRGRGGRSHTIESGSGRVTLKLHIVSVAERFRRLAAAVWPRADAGTALNATPGTQSGRGGGRASDGGAAAADQLAKPPFDAPTCATGPRPRALGSILARGATLTLCRPRRGAAAVAGLVLAIVASLRDERRPRPEVQGVAPATLRRSCGCGRSR
jgi:hypothetical protein